MQHYLYPVLFVSILLTASPVVMSADSGNRMRVDNEHVRSWNAFADQLLSLHKSRIQGKQIIETEHSGGYRNDPDYYREVTYKDKKTGKVLSIIQWETDNPDVVHSIEIFIHDDQGRVIRDYSAAYLPGQRNAPVQTLINLHHYNGGLHAFRQFDVSQDVIYEYCAGEFNGQQQKLRLFEDDLAATDDKTRALLESPLYKACFEGISAHPGKYIKPQ